MHDQRIGERPSLGHEDLLDGGIVERVGAEAVHRLGRERDELAATDE
jgi:hypothetical protein